MLRSLKALLSVRRLQYVRFNRVQHTENDLTFSMYRKDSVQVLRRQVWLTQKWEINRKPHDTEEEVFLHAMNAQFGRLGCLATEIFKKIASNEKSCSARRENTASNHLLVLFRGSATNLSKHLEPMNTNSIHFISTYLIIEKNGEKSQGQHRHTIVT